MMKKGFIRDFLIMVLGAMTIGGGVVFIIYAGLGADAMTTLENGLYVTLNIPLSLSPLLANAFFLVLLFLLDKKRVSIGTVVCPFCITLGIEVFTLFIPEVSSMVLRVVYMFAGIVVVALGIGIGAQSPTGSNPYDGFILAVSDRIHKPYNTMRPCFDAVVLIAGVLLKGSWGIGTVLAITLTGVIGQFFMNLLKKVF